MLYYKTIALMLLYFTLFHVIPTIHCFRNGVHCMEITSSRHKSVEMVCGGE